MALTSEQFKAKIAEEKRLKRQAKLLAEQGLQVSQGKQVDSGLLFEQETGKKDVLLKGAGATPELQKETFKQTISKADQDIIDRQKAATETKAETALTDEAIDIKVNREQQAKLKFQEDKTALEERIKKNRLDLEAKKQEAQQISQASTEAIKGGTAPTPGGLTSTGNLALGEGALQGIEARKATQQRSFDAFQDQTERIERGLDRAVKEEDFEQRTSLLKEKAALQKNMADFQTALEESQTEETKNALDLIDKNPTLLAGLSSDELSEFFGGTNLPTSFGVAMRTQQQALVEAQADFQKSPTQENQNKVLALQGDIDKIKLESATAKQSDLQQKVGTLQNLLDAGTIDQDQFNAALESELGIDPVTKSVGGSLFVTDPVTNKTTEIKTGVDGNPTAPTVADVGTGKVTQNYGAKTPVTSDNVPLQNGSVGHPGIDIDGFTGDAIQSFVGGTVTQIANNGGYGNQIIITDSDGNEHMYSHLRDLDAPVIMGQEINAGDAIGFMGNSGNVFGAGGKVNNAVDKETGSHLDYRVRSKGVINDSRWANPNDFIGKETLSGADSGILKINIGKTAFGTRISDAEGEKIDKIVEQTLKEQPGLTIPELRDSITDRLIGFELTDNKEFGNVLKDVMLVNAGEDGLAGEDMRGIARLVNAGKLKQAVTKVENRAMQSAKNLDPEGFIGESTVTTAVERGETLEKTIAELPESPIGVVSGTTEKWLRRLKGEAAQDIATQVVSQVAEMRKRLSGTAVTPEESKFLDPLIPELSDTPENFMIKLNQLKKNPLVQLNNVREVVNLQPLDNNSLLNREERVGLYQPEDEDVSDPDEAVVLEKDNTPPEEAEEEDTVDFELKDFLQPK